ncbi:MAG: flagellar motor protein MotB [Flavobacteriaceae bacterium]|nr:flagellar motor protein MotB [Flavobacteriaceae bacterium]|tara:strand:+ start:12673 stop:13509 length:837 start_codon:yes stop_codon:yes gene_type:complete
MFRFIFFIFFASNLCFSQPIKRHVIYFETDKYEVIETEQNRLLFFVKNLDKSKIKKISIYGFCDDRGTNQYNLVLSKERAYSIKDILYETGVDPGLITNVDGKGEILIKVIETENLNTIRGLNRKVEINVEYKNTTPQKNKNFDEKGRQLPLTLESNLMVGDNIILDKILFRTGHSYVLKESKEVLSNVAQILKEKSFLFFTIKGHVCCTSEGKDAIDRKTGKRNLSQERAKSIFYYLVKKGIDKKRMKYVGMKHKEPLGGNPKFDRRVEIEITSIKN